MKLSFRPNLFTVFRPTKSPANPDNSKGVKPISLGGFEGEWDDRGGVFQ
jgi:hypothetical protein